MAEGGGGSCGLLGSNKKQMLNHLSTPKLVVQKNLVGQEEPLRSGGVTLECIVRCRRLLMRSATHHSRLNGRQQSRDSLSGEHFLAFLQCKKSQCNKDASISKISIETRGQVWELCGFKASVPKDSPTSLYLNSQNQFIGNEGTSDGHVCILFSLAQALPRDLSPPLISFPFHMLANPR